MSHDYAHSLNPAPARQRPPLRRRLPMPAYEPPPKYSEFLQRMLVRARESLGEEFRGITAAPACGVDHQGELLAGIELAGRFDDQRMARPCPYRKSNPDVLMMQSTENAANGLNTPRNRRILAQR